MERNRLIAPNQVAFETRRGCTDALLHTDLYITKALSSRNHVTVLTIDVVKAFDIIKGLYHRAIRLSIYAFRTTS